MKHPIYSALGALACLYLALSNQRGWSFWQTVSPTRWFSSHSGATHK